MDKKGQGKVGTFLILAVVLITAIAVLLGVLSANGAKLPFSFNMGNSGAILNMIGTISKGIWDFLVKIITPAGLDENQKVIAFGMFLLILIVGMQAFKGLTKKNWFLSFTVAAIVGLIAARSLNAHIISNYISGSPVASGAFLIGVLPILAAYSFIKDWTKSPALKSVVWFFFALIYLIIFWQGFGAWAMGLTYFIFIMLAAIVDIIAPIFWEARAKAQGEKMGHFIGKLFHVHNSLTRAAPVAAATERDAGAAAIAGGVTPDDYSDRY